MKKRLYLSISTVVLTISLLVGASFALFSDNNVFEDNFITTGSVDVNTTITYEDKTVDAIKIENFDLGDTKEYFIETENSSTVNISYRLIFECTNDTKLMEYLEFNIDDTIFTFKDGNRIVTDWVQDVNDKSITNNLKIKLKESYSSDVKETLSFNFKFDAISTKLVKVENQKELDKVVDGDYVILDKSFNEDIVINKSIYLDLNSLTIDNITINSNKEDVIELVNGNVNTLDINAPLSNVYVKVKVEELNISANVVNYLYNNLAKENNITNINVEQGKVYTNSSNVSFTVVNGKENSIVELNWSETTTVSNIVIEESANQNIIINKLDDVNVEIKNPNANLETETSFESNEEIAYVANEEEFIYTTVNNTTYKNYGITLEEALSSEVKEIYLSENTYLLKETLVINRELSFYGLGNVVFEKEYGKAYSDNNLITVKNSVLFDNITFKDHVESNNGSSAISSLIDIKVNMTITNCTFENFPKNGITLRNGTALITNNIFNYGGKNGSAGNAIQIDYNSSAVIESNTFNDFENFDDEWSTTGILLLRGGSASIDNNTFDNNYSAIVISTMWDDNVYNNSIYTQKNNIFNNCTYDIKLEQYVDFIVSLDNEYYIEELNELTIISYGKQIVSTITEAVELAKNSDVIYVLEGIYDVAVKNEKGTGVSNLLITKEISIYGKGNVELTTDLPGNSSGNFQQTILIKSDNVVIDNLIINQTTHQTEEGKSTANKTVEIMSGSNIEITNCTINAITSGFYIGGPDVGNYLIENNKVIGGNIGLSINNGAGNASLEISSIKNNVFNGALFITGMRYNAWNLYDIDILPVIENNTFGYYEVTENEEVMHQFIRVVSINENKLISNEVCSIILNSNNFTSEQEITSNVYSITSFIQGSTDLPHTEENEVEGFDGTTYIRYFGYTIN